MPSIENYFETLDQLSRQRNESDKDYENYTNHIETYQDIVPRLSKELKQKSLQRLSDHIFKTKAPLLSLITSLNACFDSSDLRSDKNLQSTFNEEV